MRKASVGSGPWSCWKTARHERHQTRSATTQQSRPVRKEGSHIMQMLFYKVCALKRYGLTRPPTTQPSVRRASIGSGPWSCWKTVRHEGHQTRSVTAQPLRPVRKEGSHIMQMLFYKVCALKRYGLTRPPTTQPSVRMRKASVGSGSWIFWMTARHERQQTRSPTAQQ